MSEIREEFIKRAAESEVKIKEYIEDGISFTPFGDMFVYLQIVTPKLDDADLDGVEINTLNMIFDGDQDEEVSSRKLVFIKGGPDCKLGLKPGDQIACRGHAFSLKLPEGQFFSLREYDILGKYD